VHHPPEDLSGDYEYDLAHEQRGVRAAADERGERPGPAPAHRQVELDRDMSYDEAHDF
jgi:hypothetical protein